jgi:predicted heme/steroid binding protein
MNPDERSALVDTLLNVRIFSHIELEQYNGKNGMPAYIAYCGFVYDLSGSYFWRGGKHWVQHAAGHDLTAELSPAPHKADLLAKFPIVGRMGFDEAASDQATEGENSLDIRGQREAE